MWYSAPRHCCCLVGYLQLIGVMSLLMACSTNREISFFVAGHVHTSLAKKFQQEIPTINSLNLDFGVLTGDVVVDATPENWAAARRILSSLNTPYHVAPGNHDLWAANLEPDEGRRSRPTYRGEQFATIFGGTYSSFSIGDSLFLVLDSVTPNMGAKGNLQEQKAYFSSVLRHQGKYRNIFVFMHYLLFVTPQSKYACLTGHIHYDKGSDSPERNLWKFIESKVIGSKRTKVYVFAGDLGVPSHAERIQVPAIFDQYSNITVVAGGMGNPLQHYWVVRKKARTVDIELIPFDKTLGPLNKEDFALERYEFCR